MGVSGIWMVFGYKVNFFDWFGPIFMAIIGFIMISSDIGFKSVRELFKFFEYYLGRGIFYCYVALTIMVAEYEYAYNCTAYVVVNCNPDDLDDCIDCSNNSVESIFEGLCFIGAYVVLALGGFCIGLHFVSSDKRISSENKEGSEENQNETQDTNATPEISNTENL